MSKTAVELAREDVEAALNAAPKATGGELPKDQRSFVIGWLEGRLARLYRVETEAQRLLDALRNHRKEVGYAVDQTPSTLYGEELTLQSALNEVRGVPCVMPPQRFT